jgi:hypothetical protein
MPHNGRFWRGHFRDVYARQVRSFGDVVLNRVMPTFANLDEEAERITQAEYDRLGSMPAGDDSYYDMGDAAEDAQEEGLGFYLELTGLRQGMLNLAAASLYHMFEQQLMAFHRRELLSPAEEDEIGLLRHPVVRDRLNDIGVDMTALPAWNEVHELELVANTAKHGDGRSARELHSLKPDFFIDPIVRAAGGSMLRRSREHSPTVLTPLLGHDLYVLEDDFKHFVDVVAQFWLELGDALADAE